MPIHIALVLSLAGSLALAAILVTWATQVAGARLLVLFLCGIAVWIVGNELPTWLGADAERPALMLLATASLTSAVFLHFALVFAGRRRSRSVLAAGYGLGLVATLASVALPSGGFAPFAGVARMAIPNAVGWGTSLVWAVLAAAGQAVLLQALMRARGLQRRQLAAVCGSSAWGLFCMSGYGVAALHLPVYPWPLLFLPAYPLILVYGILRYRVFVTNSWVRRAVAWALLTSLAVLIVALVPLLPVEGVAGRAATGVLVAAACLTLAGPARRLAERVVYPGGTVTAADADAWRAALLPAESAAALASAAGELLSQRLGTAVGVAVAGDCPPPPGLWCRAEGWRWHTALVGWDAAPPGARHLGELFGAVLAEEAARLERAAALAVRERERLAQARLAELGQLAAVVAHDLRNPLNIISMAAAGADAGTRQEIRVQVDRIAHLSRDLLDYARPWHSEMADTDLAAIARRTARGTAELGAGLEGPLVARADWRRVEQALANLLDNARATGARVALEADRAADGVRLHVCDAGPGVPADLRARIFEPFVSRSPGGTGLGLAIVARIMAAHGGAAMLTERPGWSTCVTLAFPA